jgi:hypothetical protein
MIIISVLGGSWVQDQPGLHKETLSKGKEKDRFSQKLRRIKLEDMLVFALIPSFLFSLSLMHHCLSELLQFVCLFSYLFNSHLEKKIISMAWPQCIYFRDQTHLGRLNPWWEPSEEVFSQKGGGSLVFLDRISHFWKTDSIALFCLLSRLVCAQTDSWCNGVSMIPL